MPLVGYVCPIRVCRRAAGDNLRFCAAASRRGVPCIVAGQTHPERTRLRAPASPLEMRRFSFLLPMRERTTGDLEEMALLAGQGVGLVRDVQPAATIITEMTAQATAMLGRYQPS